MKKFKEKFKSNLISEYYSAIFLSALMLLSFIFFNIFISSTLFIVGIGIKAITLIISLILSILLVLYLTNIRKILKEKIIVKIKNYYLMVM